jgi:hypothetical protein
MMRRLILALAVLLQAAASYAQTNLPPAGQAAHAPTPSTKQSLLNALTNCFPDQLQGQISPFSTRQCLQDYIVSWDQFPGINQQFNVSTYQLQLTDYGQLILFNNATPVAMSIGAASAGGFYPFSFTVINIGTGAVTITPATGLVAGQANVVLQTGGTGKFVSDGTNWQAVLAGSMAAQNSNAVNITGGSITGMNDPTAAQDVANKEYVDHAAVGLSPHDAVRVATTAALPANTYANGAAGVGATLTANANGALSVDGVTVAVNDRVIVKDEVTAANNGIYTVTATGSAGAPWVLTRATDANQPGSGPHLISNGTYAFITAGTTLANSAWLVSGTVTTIGTSPVNWVRFSGGAVSSLNGATGPLNLVGGPGVSVTTASPNITISAPVPNYLTGLTLANDATTPNTVLDIGVGFATDSTNATTINAGTFTKAITGNAACVGSPPPWTSGAGGCGMGAGLNVTTTPTWWHVCLASNGGAPDYWFDSVATCSHRPAAITDVKYRRIGAFKTDSSSHIYQFLQNNDFVYYGITVTVHSFGFVSSAVLVSYDVPTGIVVNPLVYGSVSLNCNVGANASSVLSLSDAANIVSGGFVWSVICGGSNSTTLTNAALLMSQGLPTNTAGQGHYNHTASGSALSFTGSLALVGYVDRRGRDGP